MKKRWLDEAARRGLRVLILYGSAARGDADRESDRDYCAIVAEMDFEKVLALRVWLANELGEPLESLAVYVESNFLEACRRGSLFFEHIKREGRIIFDTGNLAANSFGSLKPFDRYDEELALYRRLLIATRAILDQEGGLTVFDLHVLHGIVRDACIMLTYRLGRPFFGRESAYKAAREAYPELPVSPEIHGYLTNGHLTYARRGSGGLGLRKAHSDQVVLATVESLMSFCVRKLLS